MPSSANVDLSLVPPRQSISSPTQDRPAKTRRDHALRSDEHKEQGRTSSLEWIDVDDEPKPRRRRKVKRATGRSVSSPQHQRSSSDFSRFFPKLSQILESNEAKPQARTRQDSVRSSARDEASYRRSARPTRSGQRQHDFLRANASVLSVLSALTASTERSSGSNSTITQRTYSRRGDSVRPHRRYQRSIASEMSSSPRSRASYQYRDGSDGKAARSTTSSASSLSERDSDAPNTPSSRSTFPSPTFSRNSEERKSMGNEPLVEADSEMASTFNDSELTTQSQESYEESQVADNRTRPYNDQEQPHATHPYHHQPLAAPMPAHPSVFSAQYFEEMHRSRSSSSHSSSHIPQQALQHYYHQPQLPAGVDPTSLMQEPVHESVHSGPPAAPEPPRLDQRTVLGYELLALELSSKKKTVKPMYRKFEFLNHRLLLHLQDEIAQLEEQLRSIDEAIAQLDSAETGQRSPASRRAEAYWGADIHHHRTALLGQIFIKTKQYNKAMSSYSAMVKDCAPAEASDIQDYQAWMSQEAPIHETETRFLSKSEDLVVPGRVSTPTRPAPSGSLLCCTLFLFSPPALFTIIPTLLGRIAIILTLGLTALMVRTFTQLRLSLTFWDTSICLTAYSLLMLVVACSVPQHAA